MKRAEGRGHQVVNCRGGTNGSERLARRNGSPRRHHLPHRLKPKLPNPTPIKPEMRPRNLNSSNTKSGVGSGRSPSPATAAARERSCHPAPHVSVRGRSNTRSSRTDRQWRISGVTADHWWRAASSACRYTQGHCRRGRRPSPTAVPLFRRRQPESRRRWRRQRRRWYESARATPPQQRSGPRTRA